MSVTGISSTNVFELVQAQRNLSQNAQNSANPIQQIEGDFNQLGQDLQAGNLTQAQQDFATLSSALTSAQTTLGNANANGANAIQQAFSSLQQDLQAGNTSAAQQDFAALQQSLQGAAGRHFHHRNGGAAQEINALTQDLGSLGQALQSGNLSGAQTAFAALEQQLQQTFGASTGSAATSSSSSNTAQTSGSNLNVTA